MIRAGSGFRITRDAFRNIRDGFRNNRDGFSNILDGFRNVRYTVRRIKVRHAFRDKGDNPDTRRLLECLRTQAASVLED